MSMIFSFHSVQRCVLTKQEFGDTIWYDVRLYMGGTPGTTDSEYFSIFCGNGVKSLSPFEEMWQAQEAAKKAATAPIMGDAEQPPGDLPLVEHMLTDDNGPRDPLPTPELYEELYLQKSAFDFGTDPDLAAELEEGTSPVAQEHIDANA